MIKHSKRYHSTSAEVQFLSSTLSGCASSSIFSNFGQATSKIDTCSDYVTGRLTDLSENTRSIIYFIFTISCAILILGRNFLRSRNESPQDRCNHFHHQNITLDINSNLRHKQLGCIKIPERSIFVLSLSERENLSMDEFYKLYIINIHIIN